MAQTYIETDTTTPVCGTGNNRRTAEVGGTAGTTEWSEEINASTSETVGGFTAVPVDAVVLDGGSCTVRLNVTALNMNINWDELHVRRYNSSCTLQETLNSFTSLGISLGSNGVVSTTQTLSAASTHNSGDRLVFELVFTNVDTMMAQSVGITPDQNIDVPWTLATGAVLKDPIMRGIVPWAR